MGYNTLPYLAVFLPLVVIVYQLTPSRYRKFVLLGASWIYFYLCSRMLVFYFIILTALVWLAGLGIGRLSGRKKTQKLLTYISIGGLFGQLLYLKYFNFFLGVVNLILSRHGSQMAIPYLNILVPIGVSYYTLEAAGYLLEIYWGRVNADKSFAGVSLFLGFFPQTMEGPIARYQDTARQLQAGNPVTEQNVFDGVTRILWGLMKKIVIADRLSVIVTELFNNHAKYDGVMIVVAAVSYTMQLYMEFSGVIDIILGSALLFGVKLPENFRQPFFSQSASEFWRRWHISLGVWLKTYVFYPVTTSDLTMKWNRKARKKYGKYVAKVGTSFLALTPVWLFNGLWHGANFNYIFYGLYYLFFLMLEVILEPVKKKFYTVTKADPKGKGWTLFRILRTWLIIFTGELFFRANGFTAGRQMFASMFHHFALHRLWDGTLLGFGLDKADWAVIFAGIVVVFIADVLHEKGISFKACLARRPFIVRWAALYALIFGIIIFGAYGSGYQKVDLIYAGF
ncbi:MAG: MBOAT family O-acyltransferase [Bilifractor sp.]